eukprot:TRINITY_DN38493_c0_g1_i2.p1 TRINITY_DN38493_c0_g1~~TRINITY_DN38493_c0_g1_i2.p1  ORF type:complete len:310 (+),score=83.10 TRINITY_DN38493_c0_g1_i2:29-931(+)
MASGDAREDGAQQPQLSRSVSQQLSGIFGAPGTDMSEFLPDRGLILRHGTSLQLMALASECLNESDEFGDVDPSADWKTWSERRPDFSLYYAALTDPARDGKEGVVCVLRAVMDGIPTPTPPHRPRFIIDYITTRVASRGKGLATLLVNFVVEASQIFGANTYVLALEDSCVYWMGKGFVLEQGENLKARLNIFSDTHLLRLSSDPIDQGSDEDLALAIEKDDEMEEEEEENDDAEDQDVDEDKDLQKAMELSLANAQELDVDAEMQSAMELSLAAAASSNEKEEDADLQRALAMSMEDK